MTSNVIQPADIREVAVIGLGLMGSGIAELVARSGRRVVAIEINQTFLDQGMARLRASLDKAVSRGKLTDTAREEILARIRPTDDIAAGVAAALNAARRAKHQSARTPRTACVPGYSADHLGIWCDAAADASW